VISVRKVILIKRKEFFDEEFKLEVIEESKKKEV